MHRLSLLVVAGLLAVLSAPALGTVTIDAFTDAYPANPDLPNSGRTIIFVGSTCDGSACPPNLIVNHLASDAAFQTGLSGVMGNERYAEIFYVAGTANSNILPTYGFTMNHNSMSSAWMILQYGSVTPLNTDFTIPGSTKFEIEVLSGDMYAGPRPVPCTITVTSAAGTPDEATASKTLDLINETVYEYPFADFAGIDWSDVDFIELELDASQVSSVDFGLGPFRADGQIVGTESSTWGQIKALWK